MSEKEVKEVKEGKEGKVRQGKKLQEKKNVLKIRIQIRPNKNKLMETIRE